MDGDLRGFVAAEPLSRFQIRRWPEPKG